MQSQWSQLNTDETLVSLKLRAPESQLRNKRSGVYTVYTYMYNIIICKYNYMHTLDSTHEPCDAPL